MISGTDVFLLFFFVIFFFNRAYVNGQLVCEGMFTLVMVTEKKDA